MNVSRSIAWVPSQSLGDFRQVFDRFLALEDVDQGVEGHWFPRVDIREEDRRFVILADVPGVDPASIEVSMEKNVLTLKGERVDATDTDAAKVTRRERMRGAFKRSFSLPESADAEGITAIGKYGVLEISIPKKAEIAPRRITIQTAH